MTHTAPIQKPRVTIGMPVYNGARYVRGALDSLLSQTFRNFELVISDNASTDDTGSICRDYAGRDSRVRYVRQPANMGAPRNLLYCAQQATTEYFMWAACDDSWHPRFVEVLVDALDREPDATLAFCPYQYVADDGKLIGRVRRPNYRGAHPATRIARLSRQWDDSVFYGLFRTSAIADLRFPQWWWVNREVIVNIAYPPLCNVLTKGGYVLVDSEPMWFNRMHLNKFWRRTAFESSFVLEQAAFVLRRVNVEVECLREILRAGGSLGTAAAALPAMHARVVRDSLVQLAYPPFAAARRWLSSSSTGTDDRG